MIRYLLCFLCVINYGFCQSLVEGRVSDVSGLAVSGINVLLLKGEKKTLVGWNKTDKSGRFLLKYTENADSLIISIKTIGYEEIAIPINKSNYSYDIVLKKGINTLREVVVRPPVTKKKDTLSYEVDFFTQIGDRTLSDVMKRIPGLSIDLSGKITYFGQPIEKYYIEGLDLLGGQYGLANNNLPADKVARVEILENHQPVRMLDSLRFNERTSINIRLKKKYTTIAPARAGVGLDPLLGLAEFIPMVFSPKNQFIAGLKANNTGENIAIDLDDHTNIMKPLNAAGWVDIVRVSIPNLLTERWRFNQTAYGSVNSLNKLKNDLEVRLQASYLFDQVNSSEESKTTYHIPGKPVTFTESNETRHTVRTTNLRAELSQNTKKRHLSNTFKFTLDNSDGRGRIKRETLYVNQVTGVPSLSVENSFTHLQRFGAQLFQISSEVSFRNSPMYLESSPSFFNFIPGDALTRQDVQVKEMEGGVHVSMYRNLIGVGYLLKSGLLVQKHKMQSDLFFNDELLSNEYRNDLTLSSGKVFLDQRFERKWNDFIVKVSLPLSYVMITRKDAIHIRGNSMQQRVPFEPEIVLHYASGKNWDLIAQTDRKRNFGSIRDVNYGYLLTNYRNMVIKDSPIPESIQQRTSFSVKYNNPYTYFSSWISAVFYHQKRNLMYNYLINPDGSRIITVNQDWNALRSLGLLTGLKHTFLTHKVSLGFTGGWNGTSQNVMLSSNPVTQTSNTLHGAFTWRVKLIDKVSLNGENGLSQTNNRIAELGKTSLFRQKHNFSLLGSISREHRMKVEGEYYRFSAVSVVNHSTFWNLTYTFLWNRKEIELRWSNVLNNKRFGNSTLSDFTEYNQSLNLRPSQLLVAFRWTIGAR